MKQTLEYRYWTPREDKLLAENYERIGAKGCSELLGRTASSCTHRAQKISLRSCISPRNMTKRLKLGHKGPRQGHDGEIIRNHIPAGEWGGEVTKPVPLRFVFELAEVV